MAVERVNLLPKSYRKGTAPDLQKILIGAWAFSAVVVVLFSVMKVRDVSAKEFEYNRMMETARSMGANVQEITTRIKQAEEAKKQVVEVRGFLDGRVTWTDSFKELSLLIPKSVWLSSLKTKPDSDGKVLELIGEAPSQTRMAGFLDALEKSYHFKDVIIKKSEKVEDIAPDLYEFTFEIIPAQSSVKGKPHAKAK